MNDSFTSSESDNTKQGLGVVGSVFLRLPWVRDEQQAQLTMYGTAAVLGVIALFLLLHDRPAHPDETTPPLPPEQTSTQREPYA